MGQLRKHDLHEMHNLLYFLLLLRNKDTWGVLEALGGLGVNLGLEPEGHARAWWGLVVCMLGDNLVVDTEA